MLHYPKIPDARGCPGGKCLAFDKIDGTNLHFAWDREFGWHAFGTRRDEFPLLPLGIAEFHRAHPGLEEADRLFLALLAQPIEEVFRMHPHFAQATACVAFAEYAGPNSFAGQHQPEDEKQLTLFDVLIQEQGLVGPFDFVERFGHLRVPRVVFRGRFTGKLTDDVRQGKYDVAEGVVIKGGSGGEDLWMVKVKTLEYLDLLKARFGTKWRDYWE